MESSVIIALIGVATVLVSGLVELIKMWWAKKIESQQKKRFSIDKVIDREFELNQKLYWVLGLTNATRVFVARFHNGGKYINGVPMERFSITNEVVVASHSEKIISRFQGTLINDYSGVLQRLIYTGEYMCDDTSQSNLLFEFTNKVFLYSLTDNDSPVGFICVIDPKADMEHFAALPHILSIKPLLNGTTSAV